MSRFRIENGKRIVPVLVGVNSSTGKYHKQGCRYYGSAGKEMREDKALKNGYVCGACCEKYL